MTRSALRLCLLAALTLTSARVGAHGGEDHSQDGNKSAPTSLAASPAPSGMEAPRRLPDGSLFVPKAVQRQIGLRHRLAKITPLTAALEFNGRVIADPNAGGRVQADQTGRLEPGPNGLPVLGRKVVRGQVLAWLRPAANPIERGNQLAQAAELAAQRAIAEKRLARLEQLEGAIPRKEIEAARIELEALKQRAQAVDASVAARLPLTAPASGVIAASHAVAGQVVNAGDVLFEVVDPSRLAVEALAYDPAQAADITGASAVLPGGALELVFVGAGRVLREQAMPLLFRVRSGNAPVAVGQPLKIVARTARSQSGAALPRAALVKTGAGETALWLRDGAERFVLRRVAVTPLDAVHVAVVSGLKDGERVVAEGASLLSQVR